VIERQQNAYLRPSGAAHPLMDGFEGMRRTIHGAARVELKETAKDGCPLLTVPSYPDLPMEEVYVREGSAEYPAVFLREAGKGRVAYFPFDLDRTFWEVLHPDHGRLIANAVRWVSRDRWQVKVAGQGVVDLALWKQERSITLHIVNLTNPMMMRAPFREIIPVSGQQVTLDLGGQKPKAVRLLVSGVAAKWAMKGTLLEMATPPIGLHEVVAIDL
jgi:hypothetical protein